MVNFRELRAKAENSTCLVIGDIILDKYIMGEVERISPEAPIPVLRVKEEKSVLGGAANVAGNVKGYHVNTYLCGILGNDKDAKEVRSILQEHGINFIGIETQDRRTTVKTRVIGMNQQLVRIDQEDTYAMDNADEVVMIGNIRAIISEVNSVIVSDYNKGVCTDTFCKTVIDICNENNIPVIVDPKSSDWSKYMGAYLVTPNFKEFKEVIGKEVANNEDTIKCAAGELFDKYHMNQVLVTRSQYGMTIVEKVRGVKTFQTVQQEVFDVSGAGDTVIGTIAALIAMNCELWDAVEVSNYAAGLSVSKPGTYMVSMEEVMEYMDRYDKDLINKVVSRETLASLVKNWKKSGEKIVFTNGCFDILHVGHIEYMSRASKLGSKLIVGLNSDSSVKRLKGETRPINPENVRAEMLAALQCVNAVVIFEEDTPENLIRDVKPDCLVKGGDYKIEDIVGREYAGEVKTIPITDGFSTTNLIEKIKKS